jgi:hypothetical protein
MRKLVVVLVVAALMSGISVAAFAAAPPTATQPVNVFWTVGRWIRLSIPVAEHNVDLGYVDGAYDPVTGALHPIYRTGLRVTVRTNIAAGFTLTASATNIGAIAADLTRFDIIGGDLTAWTALDTMQTLLTRSSPGTVHVTNLGYRYRGTTADLPGSYTVRVTFTATAR